MSNVVRFPGMTKGTVGVDDVLSAASELEEVFVAGIGKDGEFYFASSTGDAAEILMWLEQWKYNLLSGQYED